MILKLSHVLESPSRALEEAWVPGDSGVATYLPPDFTSVREKYSLVQAPGFVAFLFLHSLTNLN